MKCNLSRTDRLVRGVLGIALAAGGLIFASGPYRIAAVLLGALIVFSAVMGFCHVYKFMRLSTVRKDDGAN